MLDNYLIVHKNILPDYFGKVLEARRMLDSGKVKEVSQAAKLAGISRSTYYKYKDYIFEPSDISGGRKAVLSFMLEHETGVLSALLARISSAGANVLTITQSLPIHNMASVTVSMDVSSMTEPLSAMLKDIEAAPGVEKARLLAVE